MSRRTVIPIAAAALVYFAGSILAGAPAHSGGMAGDGCHTDTKGKVGPVGEVHWHAPDTRERAGPCLGKERPRVKAVEHPDGYLVVEKVREVIVEKEVRVEVEVPAPVPECRNAWRRWNATVNDYYLGRSGDLEDRGTALAECLSARPQRE